MRLVWLTGGSINQHRCLRRGGHSRKEKEKMDKPGMVLVVESPGTGNPSLPLETLRAIGLKVIVAHSSREAITVIWHNEPIVIFLANGLKDGARGVEVQAAIRVMKGYEPSIIAMSPEINPTNPEWRLKRLYPNLGASVYMLLKYALIEQDFRRVLLVENPRAEARVPEKVFAPAGCVLLDTKYTAQSALDVVWRDRPPIIVLDEELGAMSTGQDTLRDLAKVEDYFPIVIGLAENLATEFHAARGPDLETQLSLVLREASDRLGQKAPNA